MVAPDFIAGDWGTSRLKLYLCANCDNKEPAILDTRFGPGVAVLNGRCEETFFEVAGDWLQSNRPVPAIVSGMAGSSIGWKEAPYLTCPIAIDEIGANRILFRARDIEISIVEGLEVENPLGAPDIMRGEELQILGWAHSTGFSSAETQLLALPGTHNKWVLVRDGKLETFLTAPTGELFALLVKHSVLIGSETSAPLNGEFFRQGIDAIDNLGDANLLHALFATRSRQVLKRMPAGEADSYLSGLLIGSDVAGAVAMFQKLCPDIETVTIIGEARLSACYRTALEHHGLKVLECGTSIVAAAGYSAVYKRWYGDQA